MEMLVISGEDIERHISPELVINSVVKAFSIIDEEDTIIPERLVITYDEYWWGIMSCINRNLGFITKIVNVIPKNRTINLPTTSGIAVLFDVYTGQPLAIINGTILTAYRTGATCALAAKLLSCSTGGTVSIIGTGFQARYILKCLNSIFKIDRLLLYNRSMGKLRDFIKYLENYSINYEICNRLEDAHKADIVIESTTSTEPVILGKYLPEMYVVISIGVRGPNFTTIDSECVRNSDLVVVDRKESVLRETHDLRQVKIEDSKIIDFSKIVKNSFKVDRGIHRKILFKSVGTAVQDLVVSYEIYKYLKDRGICTTISI